MNWHSMAEFLSMGGRGAFVWGSYGASFLLIAMELYVLIRRRRQSLRHLRQLQRIEGEQ